MLRRFACWFGAASVAALLLLSGLETTASYVVQTAQAVSVSGPSATLSASPTSIAPGGSSTLTWSSTNATVCKGFGGLSTGDATSGSVTVNPITNTTCGISCIGSASVASTVTTLTVSQTHVVNANGNCAGAHAGSAGDPYPFSCIASAIKRLPAGGGTVIVGDGYWANSASATTIGRGNFNLVGNSLNARIVVTGSNQINLGPGGNIRISNLTIDPTNYTDGHLNPFHFFNTQGSSLTNCTVLSDPNTGLAVVLFEGGANNQVIANSFGLNAVGGGGGDQLQLNPLGGTPNSGFLVQGNTLDSVGFYIIGQNQLLVTGNNVHNQSSGNEVFIFDAPDPNASITNTYNIIDNNTLNAAALNNVVIAGLTQDPGLPIANVDNFIISNNTLTGTKAWISLQAPDDHCFGTNDCAPMPNPSSNAKILNNHLTSYWTFSYISIRGGVGTVTNPLVEGNSILGTTAGQILQDANTFNPTITGNSVSSS